MYVFATRGREGLGLFSLHVCIRSLEFNTADITSLNLKDVEVQTNILIDRSTQLFPCLLPSDSFLRLFKVHVDVMVKVFEAFSRWLWPGLYNGRAGSTSRKQDVGCQLASLFPAPLSVCMFIGQESLLSEVRKAGMPGKNTFLEAIKPQSWKNRTRAVVCCRGRQQSIYVLTGILPQCGCVSFPGGKQRMRINLASHTLSLSASVKLLYGTLGPLVSALRVT